MTKNKPTPAPTPPETPTPETPSHPDGTEWTAAKPPPPELTPLELGAIGHQAHRVYRSARSSEGNVPAFKDLPPEHKNAWAEAAKAIAQAAAGKEVDAGPDPEWSTADRQFIAKALGERRATLIRDAGETGEKRRERLTAELAEVDPDMEPSAPSGTELDAIDGVLAKLAT